MESSFTPKYPGSGTLTLSGDGDDSRSRDFIASGTLFKFGTAGESKSFDFVGSGLKTLSGVARRKCCRPRRTAIGRDENTILFDFLDEKNIGIGTTGIQISGTTSAPVVVSSRR